MEMYSMKNKQDLFKRTPSTLDVLHDYAPLILFYGALILLICVVFGLLIYCQTTVSLGHEYGVN